MFTKEVYTVNQKQFDEIVHMNKTNDYVITYNYEGIKDPQTKKI